MVIGIRTLLMINAILFLDHDAKFFLKLFYFKFILFYLFSFNILFIFLFIHFIHFYLSILGVGFSNRLL